MTIVKQYYKEHKFGFISLLLLVMVALLFCISKRAFHVDESLSFTLSNHPTGWVSYKPFGWFEKLFFSNYAVTDSPFNYSGVYSNQYWDVHPPLYYDILHTICSLFPYRFSIWFGLIINIGSFIVSLVIIYFIVYKQTNKDYLSALAMLLFGLNKHVLDCVIFIRMYMLLTMFVLMFLFFATNIISNKNKRNYLGLFVITILGGLTHYHFYFIIGSLSLIIAIYLIINKEYKKTIISFVVVCIAGLLNLFVFFPATFFHLESDHASNAIKHINNFSMRLEWVYKYIQISGGVILFAIALIVLAILIKKSKTASRDYSIICLTSFLVSFLAIIESTDMFSNRYIIPTLPFLFVGIVIGLYEILENRTHKDLVCIFACIMLIFLNLSFKQIIENINTDKSWEFAKEHQDEVAFVVTVDDIHDYEINELFTDLRWYPATAITQIGKEFPNQIENNFILYIQKELNQEEAFEYLKSQTKGIENATMIKQNINKYLFNVYEVTIN